MEINEDGVVINGSNESITPTGESSFNKFYKFIKTLYSDQVDKFEKSKLFPVPFFCDEALLKNINREICSILDSLTSHTEIEFLSITRFEDLSIIKIDSFATFLEKAGNKKNDPELVKLTWKKFFLNSEGIVTAGQITLNFATEKLLQTQDLSIGEFNHASSEIYVTGSNFDWVERSFEQLIPFIESTRLAGIYKPLWLFRNKHFISITSTIFSFMGLNVGILYSLRIFNNSNSEKSNYLKLITDNKNINEKINLLSQYFFSPTKSVWYEPIITLGCGALSYAIIYYSAMFLLPKLTPSSHIAIGLASTRASRHLNTFRFIIFTLLICGIVVPLLFKIIFT